MDMKTKLAGLMAQCLTDTWQDAQGLPTAEEIRGLLAVPPDPKMGDYALPVFRLAKALRMAPPKIATTVVEKWSHEDVARAEAVNGYVNFFLNRVNFAAETLESVLKAGENYGSSDMGNGKTICLDYSSINIAKRFHIGHLSTTMIGHSLRRIYDFLGYKTVGNQGGGDGAARFFDPDRAVIDGYSVKCGLSRAHEHRGYPPLERIGAEIRQYLLIHRQRAAARDGAEQGERKHSARNSAELGDRLKAGGERRERARAAQHTYPKHKPCQHGQQFHGAAKSL